MSERAVRDYGVITAAYFAFTVTDGALRMLVLLALHEMGRSPLEIVSLFLLYEFFGIVTNLVGGALATRFGLASTLHAGLALQVLALSLLAAFHDSLTLPLLLGTQALSGIAKDLTKMSAKSYIKLLVRDEERGLLLRWVALLTGSKNALKGVGFFAGGLLLATLGLRDACLTMAGALIVTLLGAWSMLPRLAASPGKAKAGWRSLLVREPRIRWLSLARLFLFGSRDAWFALALPVYLASALSWSHTAVGAFLATWVIGYGIVQAAAPLVVLGRIGPSRSAPDARDLGAYAAALLLPLGGIVAASCAAAPGGPTLILGLGVYGVLFALNSAAHSYLVVAYAERGGVALDVGFYYMANAAGRLVGTLLSGALYQAFGGEVRGLVACLLAACGFVATSALLCIPLRAAEGRAAASELAATGS
jgi:MFS family permease